MKWFHDTLRCIQSDVNFLRETKHRILFSFNLFLFFFFFFLISLPTIIFIATELEHVKPVDAQHNYGKSDNIVKLHRLTVFQPIRICLEFFLFFFIHSTLVVFHEIGNYVTSNNLPGANRRMERKNPFWNKDSLQLQDENLISLRLIEKTIFYEQAYDFNL